MSSIWQEDKDTKILWVTLLAMKDRDGVVSGSMVGLARVAGLTLDECRKAMSKLTAPDPESKSQEHDGRRVVMMEGGWRVLNHLKYRDKISEEYRREYQRRKQAEYRARKKGTPLPGETIHERTGVTPHEYQ